MGKADSRTSGDKGGGTITFLKNVVLFLDVAFAVLILFGCKDFDNTGKVGAIGMATVLLLSAICISV